MKNLLISLTFLAGTFTPSLYSMGCESVVERQYREMMQKNMLTMVAKGQVTIKALIQELQGCQAAIEQIRKLAKKGDVQAIVNLLENNAPEEDAADSNDNDNMDESDS
jgi:prephenate dehydrogenase